MKRVYILALVGLFLWSCDVQLYDIPVKDGKLAGILPMTGGRVQYQFGEAVPGVSGKTIFSRIRRYVALHVEQPGNTIAQSDPNTLEIISSAQLRGGFYKARGMSYLVGNTDIALIIQIKDGGYQVIAGNFRVDSGVVPGKLQTEGRKHIEYPSQVYPEQYRLHFADLDKQMKDLNESIRDAALTE